MQLIGENMETPRINIVIVTCSGDTFNHELAPKAFEALIREWGDCKRRELATPLFKVKDTYLNFYHIESITIER